MSETIGARFKKNWSEVECWVWDEIHSGHIADFNAKYNNTLDPDKPDGWDDNNHQRQLSTTFLITLLTEEFFLNAITFKGVRIVGACFKGEINLQHVKLEYQLWLEFCRFNGSLRLMNFLINDWFSLESSWISGTLDLNGAQLNSYVSFKEMKVEGSVDMISVRVGSNLKLDFSTVKGNLSMDYLEVGRNLFARSTLFAEDRQVNLCFANIGSTLDFSGSTIYEMDLTSTSVGAELRLGSGRSLPPNWKGVSRMVLWNTTVAAVQDADVNSWPNNLELEGFTYSRLGGFGATGAANMAERKTGDFINWLERDKTFSPRPYEYLAKALNEAGFPSKANAILHAGRVRSRKLALNKDGQKRHEYNRWFGLVLLQSIIGFGLGARYFRVLFWLLGFSFVGFLILLLANHAPYPDYYKMAWASFDVTLPIVELNQDYADYIFKDSAQWVKTYFYFQKMIGYVLGGFIVAGLAGLTQKNS